MDIPCVQYYCLLLDALLINLVKPNVVLDWFDTVDFRYHQL